MNCKIICIVSLLTTTALQADYFSQGAAIMNTLNKLEEQRNDMTTERDEHGQTPLHRVEDPEKVQQLLAEGADLNARDNKGDTPLHVSFSNPEKIQLLIEAGADVNAQNKYGSTPLHEATNWARVEAVKMLVKYADLNSKDNSGNTALHHAASQPMVHLGRALEIATLLVEHGADVNATNDAGRTPIQIAEAELAWHSEHTEICNWNLVKLFAQHGAQNSCITKKGKEVFEQAQK